MRGDLYQIALIVLGVVATAFFGYFFYMEVFPEYKIYQNDYIALEEFRSNYTHEPPPEFKEGVKQIVFEREDKGPARIDRCISCHVAEQLPHFSPTKLEHDANGIIVRNAEGIPVQVTNEDYVWSKLDQKIAELTDDKVLAQLEKEGNWSAIKERKREAERLQSLKTAKVGDHVYDVTKALRMHPLIGKETRPFEFHPLEEYGCTSCHSGNGRGLTAEKAHGPVFDGEYEIENLGYRPQFTEKDPKNDPEFARVFNNKPGDALIFQTTPILVNSLIQSSCAQCHVKEVQTTSASSAAEKASAASNDADMEQLLKNYYRGEQLYISQACYACHKIAGVARGGVGPELTRAGDNYPWYLKESIVWPQADLRTSTMPNFSFDHVELEDLMTYLLGQKGPTKAISQMDYKSAIQQWEAGRKQPWEKSIPPSEIHDLRASMTIFATQGCAACHRLEGFESNVGYRIEKEGKPTFDQLYREKEWFQKLFHEEIHGSSLVKKIEKHAKEIDRHIVDGVRSGSIIEEIEAKYPEVIEALYSNFRFASRAKNAHYRELSEKATDPQKKKEALEHLEKWKERVHRVLMMYVQEYGLGRLIGPRPNWSGVYNSDEWLMEHFHNPPGHVPRSIMPIMPFDDSKFHALVYMLDVLGKRNRDAVHAIWKNRGFNPEQAFQIHCSQCHGEYLQGNGPVATWIYPIPKNLRNAEFLRNLTKENAIQSITHGVRGTPMPPWGETPKDKETYDGIPVLSAEEIGKIVNWLYSSLPGATVIRGSEDVPKWHYTPQDVLDDLQREGGDAELGIKQSEGVSAVFNREPNPLSGGEKDVYYIKKKYYTAENLEAGKFFFEVNCAVCHGADADGSGIRASIMLDAKPRMLTNLDWINRRDDLRLLRSIKYGVPGTAMTPWGDLTSSIQRMQLVMFIRSLSAEREKREELSKKLYGAFNESEIQVDRARMKEYPDIEVLEKEIAEIQLKLNAAAGGEEKNDKGVEAALDLYKKQLELSANLNKLQAKDKLLVDLRMLIAKEGDLYQAIGNDMISAGIDSVIWKALLHMIAVNEGRVKYKDGKLSIDNDPKKLALIDDNAKKISKELDAKIALEEKEKVIIEGKLQSVDREQQLNAVDARIISYKKVKARVEHNVKEIESLHKQEQEILDKYNK